MEGKTERLMSRAKEVRGGSRKRGGVEKEKETKRQMQRVNRGGGWRNEGGGREEEEEERNLNYWHRKLLKLSRPPAR